MSGTVRKGSKTTIYRHHFLFLCSLFFIFEEERWFNIVPISIIFRVHEQGRHRLGHLRLLVRSVLRVLHLLRRQQQRQQQLRHRQLILSLLGRRPLHLHFLQGLYSIYNVNLAQYFAKVQLIAKVQYIVQLYCTRSRLTGCPYFGVKLSCILKLLCSMQATTTIDIFYWRVSFYYFFTNSLKTAKNSK